MERSSGRWQCLAWAGPLAAWLCSVAVVVGVMRLGGVRWPEAIAITAASVALAAFGFLTAVAARRARSWITKHVTIGMIGRLTLWLLVVTVIVTVMIVTGVEVSVAVTVATSAVLVTGSIMRLARPGRAGTA